MRYWIIVLTIIVFLGTTSNASNNDQDRSGLLLKSKSIVSAKIFKMVPYEKLPPQTAQPIKKEFYQKILLDFNKHFKNRSNDITYLSDNLKVKGVITFPQDFKPSKKYPIIIHNRGGFYERGRIVTTVRVGRDYANKGYIIFEPQYRGVAGGEGREEFGGREVNDIINLLKIAKSFSFVDEKNTFIIGRSRGGMMTYLAIKHGAKVN
ncbi:alpha/beta hydrolase family protein, partial [Thermodesulfobacteriota bacterium]